MAHGEQNSTDKGNTMPAFAYTMPVHREVELGEISVCTDCMLISANGECGELDPTQPEPWALWGMGYHEAMGRERAYTDGEITDLDEYTSDELGFSYSSCEGCGSSLGGDRFAFTMTRWHVSEAIRMHARMVQAHDLGVAAIVRRFVARHIAEDKRA